MKHEKSDLDMVSVHFLFVLSNEKSFHCEIVNNTLLLDGENLKRKFYRFTVEKKISNSKNSTIMVSVSIFLREETF